MARFVGMQKSEKDDWRTPVEEVLPWHERFHFTVDAAASDENHLFDRYCTERDDGLSLDWGIWGLDWNCSCLCHQSNALIAANQSRVPLTTFLQTLERVMAWILGVEIANAPEHGSHSSSVELIPSNAYECWKKRGGIVNPLRDVHGRDLTALPSQIIGLGSDLSDYLSSGTLNVGLSVVIGGNHAAPTAVVLNNSHKITSSPYEMLIALEQYLGTLFRPVEHATAKSITTTLSLGSLLNQFWSTSCNTCRQCIAQPVRGYINPPYSHGRAAKWVALAAKTSQENNALWVMLLPPSVGTRWFHEYIWDKDTSAWRKNVEGHFPDYRIHFLGLKDSPMQGNLWVVFHPW